MGRLPTGSEKKTPSRVKAGSLTRFRKQYLRIASLGSEEANCHVASCSGNPNHLTKTFNWSSSSQPWLRNRSKTNSGPSLIWSPTLKRAGALRALVHLPSLPGGAGAPVTWSLLTVRRPLGLSTRNRCPSVCSTMYGPWVLNPSFFREREWASRYTQSPALTELFFSLVRASNARLYVAWALPSCRRTAGMRALRSSTYCSAAVEASSVLSSACLSRGMRSMPISWSRLGLTKAKGIFPVLACTCVLYAVVRRDR